MENENSFLRGRERNVSESRDSQRNDPRLASLKNLRTVSKCGNDSEGEGYIRTKLGHSVKPEECERERKGIYPSSSQSNFRDKPRRRVPVHSQRLQESRKPEWIFAALFSLPVITLSLRRPPPRLFRARLFPPPPVDITFLLSLSTSFLFFRQQHLCPPKKVSQIGSQLPRSLFLSCCRRGRGRLPDAQRGEMERERS